ncbi:MAG TPA: glycosyltransferase family 87 protein [Candidatus Limnocylindria bacterium]|nr:glycosyltransferase family 87 protein [Candidatus Limnocylindria bacterium]
MRRAGFIGATALSAVAMFIAFGATGMPASTYRNGDFLQFWLQPQALGADVSPYDPVWWAVMHARLGIHPLFPQAVYPPYDAIVFLPIALLPLAYAAAAWLVGQLVAVGAVALLIARRIGVRGQRSVFLAVVAGFQSVWLLVVGGNVTGFLFAALGAAYIAALDRRPFRCGVLLGLLVAKPHPFVIVGLAALACATRTERRGLVLGALATAAPLIVLTAVLHPSWYVEWLPSALGLQGTGGSNATIWTIGRTFGSQSPLAGAAIALALIAALAVWLRRARPSLGVAIAAAIPVSLAVAPHGWSYDQLQLLIPIAFVLDRIGTLPSRARAIALTAIALGASTLPWLLYVVAFRRGGEELSVLTPIAVFAAVLLVPRASVEAPGQRRSARLYHGATLRRGGSA